MNAPPATPPVDDHVFLLGRPPIAEFLGFIQTMAAEGRTANQGQLTAEWRKANDHVINLEKVEAAFADNPPTQQIPAELQPLAAQVLDHPFFRRSFQFVPTDLLMVDLDRLVVFQKFINLGFVGNLRASFGATPTPEEVFRLAMSMDRGWQPVTVGQTAPNSFSFVAPSKDFRFLEATLLRPDQVSDYPASGPTAAILGLAVGHGSNLLNAFHVDGRLVRNNGSHRAYALRDMGVSQAPCVVQHITRRDELDLIGSQDLQLNPDRYLKSARPPVLKDYFDERLRKVVQVPRKNRLLRVSFTVEQTEIPAA